MLQCHRMDLVKLDVGKGNMEYRIDHAVLLAKKEMTNGRNTSSHA